MLTTVYCSSAPSLVSDFVKVICRLLSKSDLSGISGSHEKRGTAALIGVGFRWARKEESWQAVGKKEVRAARGWEKLEKPKKPQTLQDGVGSD